MTEVDIKRSNVRRCFISKIYTYHFARESTLYPLHPIGYIARCGS